MPIYEFKCQTCDKAIEKVMKMSDPHPTHCDCGAEGSLVKIISKTNFVLKGQGWYETDFKNKPKSKQESTSSAAAASTKESSPPAEASSSAAATTDSTTKSESTAKPTSADKTTQ